MLKDLVILGVLSLELAALWVLVRPLIDHETRLLATVGRRRRMKRARR